MEIPENMHEVANRPAHKASLLPPFEGGFFQPKCHVVAQTKGYIRYAFGVAGLNFISWSCSRACFVLDRGFNYFAEF